MWSLDAGRDLCVSYRRMPSDFARREGYTRIDNRLADQPEDPEFLATIRRLRAQGQTVLYAAPGQLMETATLRCVHCHKLQIKNPKRVRPRNYCAKCHAYVCDTPACRLDCNPMAKQIDHALEAIVKSEQSV